MNKNYVPDWKLERYLLGGLPAKELRAIAELERAGGELRARIAALRASNAEILAVCPPPPMTAKAGINAETRVRYAPPGGFQRRRGYSGILRWTIPALACAALILVLPLNISVDRPFDGAEPFGDRAKGVAASAEQPVPSLEVWRKAGDAAERLAPESAARDGDIVQLRYFVPEPCYGALVSIDGRGVLTVHLSGAGGKAVPLTPGRTVTLSTSYQLDDAPEYEAFYLVTASDSFDLASVAAVIAGHTIDGGQNLTLPQKRVTAFTLRKSGENGIY